MNDLLQRLRRSGLKVTPRRKAIIELFLQKDGALTPSDVYDGLRSRMEKCGLPGVYRNLDTLESCGVLFRFVTFGGERRYALCKTGSESGHHHHIVCTSCGKVGDVTDCHFYDGMPVEGFRLVSHIVQLHGLCETCMEKENRSPSSA